MIIFKCSLWKTNDFLRTPLFVAQGPPGGLRWAGTTLKERTRGGPRAGSLCQGVRRRQDQHLHKEKSLREERWKRETNWLMEVKIRPEEGTLNWVPGPGRPLKLEFHPLSLGTSPLSLARAAWRLAGSGEEKFLFLWASPGSNHQSVGKIFPPPSCLLGAGMKLSSRLSWTSLTP